MYGSNNFTENITPQQKEVILTRNPFLCRSEYSVLQDTHNKLTEKWLSHLNQCVVMNTYDITAERASGSDKDGDQMNVMYSEDNSQFRTGIYTDLPVVMDLEENVTANSVPYTTENIIANILNAGANTIGEYSNLGTCYHNKVSDNPELMKKWQETVNLICILNAKSINSAKTGKKPQMPKWISQNKGYIPYFMRYAGSYYRRQKQFSSAKSNMNQLCWSIEQWQKDLQWQKTDPSFDYTIYLKENFTADEMVTRLLLQPIKDYNKKVASVKTNQHIHKKLWVNDNLEKLRKKHKKKQAERAENGKKIYDFDEKKVRRNLESQYEPPATDYKQWQAETKAKLLEIVTVGSELACYLVDIFYGQHPNWDKELCWQLMGNEIVGNMTSVEHEIPVQVKGETEKSFKFLGRDYEMVSYIKET